jgi:hypothetical protein
MQGNPAAAKAALRSIESPTPTPAPDPRRAGIVVILPRGETFRNFVYTGALDLLGEEADLTVLSVFPTPEFERMLKERFDRALPLESAQDRWTVRFLREVLDMAHGRWLWSGAARERWRLRDEEATDLKKWLKREGKKLACYPFASPWGLQRLSAIERECSRRLSVTDRYLDLYRTLKPKLVFNASHVHSVIATQAVEAAQWLGIPTATFIFSWDNLTSQGRIMLPYDYFLVWNEQLREQLLEIYPHIDRSQVFVVGAPQFDAHFDPRYHWTREEFCEKIGADPARPIVFYSTGMANQMPGEPVIVQNIARMLEDLPLKQRPQLLVRVYPKDRTNRFDALKKTLPDALFPEIPWEKNWFTPKIEDAYLLINSLRHAAVGINIASTISLELCMFDKPVINVAYNPTGVDIGAVDIPAYYRFDHYRPIVESGAIRLASSEEEMRRLLVEALTNPAADRRERNALLKQMFGDLLDGESWRRAATCLTNLARINK